MHPMSQPCLEPGMQYGSIFLRAFSTYAVVKFYLYLKVTSLEGRPRKAFHKRGITGDGQS